MVITITTVVPAKELTPADSKLGQYPRPPLRACSSVSQCHWIPALSGMTTDENPLDVTFSCVP